MHNNFKQYYEGDMQVKTSFQYKLFEVFGIPADATEVALCVVKRKPTGDSHLFFSKLTDNKGLTTTDWNEKASIISHSILLNIRLSKHKHTHKFYIKVLASS